MKDTERIWLSQRLQGRAVPLIAEEVFWSHPHECAKHATASFAQEEALLTFVLNGLSKVMGLPQLKLSWIDVAGPASLRDEALERLEGSTCLLAPGDIAWKTDIDTLRALENGLQTAGSLGAVAAKYLINSEREAE